jgi:hypothetical protein
MIASKPHLPDLGPPAAKPRLTASELVAALKALDLEQIQLARILDKSSAIVRVWCRPGGSAPGYASLLIRMLLARPELRTLIQAPSSTGRGRPPMPPEARTQPKRKRRKAA